MEIRRTTGRRILLLMAFAGLVTAQVPTARLEGTVEDPSGALIPQAKLSLVNNGTQVQINDTHIGEGAAGLDKPFGGNDSLSLRMYGDDNNGHYPLRSGQVRWPAALAEIYQNTNVLACASDPHPQPASTTRSPASSRSLRHTRSIFEICASSSVESGVGKWAQV